MYGPPRGTDAGRTELIMEEVLLAEADRLIESGTRDPDGAIAALIVLAERCADRGKSEEQAYCLMSAIRVGTTPMLAARVTPLCLDLIRLQPRLLYIRHLALLYDLQEKNDDARRVFLWIATIAGKRGIDAVTPQELGTLFSPASTRLVSDGLSPNDRHFEMLLKLARVCADKDDIQGALRALDSALALKPDDPVAVSFRNDLMRRTQGE
jgi:hypothetical protein